ncbi:MAG: proton-conducting transporter membrane subunit [Lacunisphaera sp.]|nr:proton-conducting transporter membrane subunit [Lacunisphaera sp.]
MATALLIILFVPLLGAIAALVAGRRLGAQTAWVVLLAPALACAATVWLVLQFAPGTRTVIEWPWIPSLGLNLTFVVDGLALFFGLVVSGVGVLVVFYSAHYLDHHYRDHGRFYCYLMLFMGAMLGTVFAGNLLLLFVCWELTGVTSFLLIGFLHDKGESRAGARMALLVTGGTGLAMLAGIVLLGQAAGTYELAALLDGVAKGASPGRLNAAFVLIALGALGKSAQFPFQFWLPNAMAAPTPVSAYLHSATMVKLGIFLIARIFPVFRETELWSPLLVTVCFGTMGFGALLALMSHDLKAILAYSTVSQLGFLLGYYGMASPAGAQGDFLHIASHVFYKGCLFMVVGIVDHATGTRDVRELGGLRHRLPLLAGITAVAAASMAGLPGTLGFISKEYMLKEKFDYWEGAAALNWYPMVLVVLASVLKVAFSVRLFWGVFGGKPRPELAKNFHAPGLAVQLPPLLLAGACLAFGLFPTVLGGALDRLHTVGLHHPVDLEFHIWHGVTREFIMSMLIVAAGAGTFLLLQLERWRWARVPAWLRFDAGFEAAVDWLPRGAKLLGRGLRFDRQFDFLPIVLGFTVLLLGGFWWRHRGELWPGLPVWADINPLRAFVVGLIAVAVGMVMHMRRWTSQLIAVSVIGFLVTFYYVLFRAPDLAMTQILVESATLLLVLLLLARFPRSAELSEATRAFPVGRQVMNAVIAGGMGLLVTLGALMAMKHKHAEPAGSYYLENSQPLAHGTNAVNTILVDFRGFDTLLEATVLVVACLGALGLLMRYRRTAEEWAAGAMGPAGYGLGRTTDQKKEKKSP